MHSQLHHSRQLGGSWASASPHAARLCAVQRGWRRVWRAPESRQQTLPPDWGLAPQAAKCPPRTAPALSRQATWSTSRILDAAVTAVAAPCTGMHEQALHQIALALNINALPADTGVTCPPGQDYFPILRSAGRGLCEPPQQGPAALQHAIRDPV